MNGTTKYMLAVLLLAAAPDLPALPAAAETVSVAESQVKAAYLYQFAKFIEWPAEGETLTISVLGKSAVGDALAAVAGKTVKGRRVVVVPLKSVEELKGSGSDMLFIAASEKQRLPSVLAAVAGRPVVTVSDIKRFMNAGGMIGFVMQNDKVRFEINHGAAQRARIRISSQLLKLATEVSD